MLLAFATGVVFFLAFFTIFAIVLRVKASRAKQRTREDGCGEGCVCASRDEDDPRECPHDEEKR